MEVFLFSNGFEVFQMFLSNLEYIVAFDGYYSRKERKKFLQAAFNSVHNTIWSVAPKSPLVAESPSDFDVVKVHGDVDAAVHGLSHHMHIKSVTEQRKITRRLNNLPPPPSEPMIKTTRFLNSWKFSFVSGFDLIL